MNSLQNPSVEPAYGDIFGRKFKALRVSLTQACDFSCVYCVPEGMKFRRLDDELTVNEFERVIAAIHRTANLEKVRITGGEPLLYRKFDDFVEVIGNLGVPQLSITSNGSNMTKKAALLWKNHFRSINFSFDSLQPEKFNRISRGGNFQRSLDSVRACLEIGFTIKFNMVVMNGYNQDEIVSMLEFCLENGIELRYIELMRMGHVNDFFDETFVSKKYILDQIKANFRIEKKQTPPESTAELYQVEDIGRFGIIANESTPFCRGCNRLRLTSNGRLYGCISSIKGYDVRPLINLPQEETNQALDTMLREAMKTKQLSGFTGAPTYMKHLGG